MLLPALNKARDRAKSINCISNLNQIGKIMSMYANDYDMMTPPTESTMPLYGWMDYLYCYSHPNVAISIKICARDATGNLLNSPLPPFLCPSQTNTTGHVYGNYARNYYMCGQIAAGNKFPSLKGIRHHSERIMIGESRNSWNSTDFLTINRTDYRHNKCVNLLFVDGHVIAMPYPASGRGDYLWG